MPPKRVRAATTPPAAEPERAAKRTRVAKTTEKAPAKATAARTAAKKVAAASKEAASKKAVPKKAVAKKELAKKEPAKKAVPHARAKTATVTPEVKKDDPYGTPELKTLRDHATINEAQYTKPLDVFVCGEGANGELGLGNAKGQMDVKRPRFNKNLEDKKVVRIAAGGMHLVALTADNKILTWGVNDEGALGRDTKWEAPTRDVDASDSDSDDDTTGLNPLESVPGEIPENRFHPGAKFVDVIAGDSCSLALTDQGRVYGWGTFKSNEGTLGLTPDVRVARQPVLLDQLKDIVKISCGANHVLALNRKGVLYSFGAGQQHQLARQVIKRSEVNATIPGPVPIKEGRRTVKIKDIACGSYNSFAIGDNNKVYSWGLNNYGQCGFADNLNSEEGSIIKTPTWVENLRAVKQITGGGMHSIAVAEDGDILVWGRCDGAQSGLDLSKVPKENLVLPEVGPDQPAPPKTAAKVVGIPTEVTGIDGKGTFVATGADHCIAINEKGRAYSWGFSVAYQTGQGTTEDVKVATLIDNTATRERKLVWAGAGGQYSALAAYQDEKPKTNGTS